VEFSGGGIEFVNLFLVSYEPFIRVDSGLLIKEVCIVVKPGICNNESSSSEQTQSGAMRRGP
jgi:hypothetical protein